MQTEYRAVDIAARAAREGVDWPAALDQLRGFYAEIDARLAKTTAHLALPCARGCARCCEESVWLTRLEFYGAWHYLQTHVDAATLSATVAEGLQLYERHRETLQALADPELSPALRQSLTLSLRFRCPLLDAAGACRVYPMREILGRLFGATFNDASGIYGCAEVGAHLAGQRLTLLKARPTAERIHALPLAGKQRVYPAWIFELYGEGRSDAAP